MNRRELFKMALGAPLVATLTKLGLMREKCYNLTVRVWFGQSNDNQWHVYDKTYTTTPDGRAWTEEYIDGALARVEVKYEQA